jgi:hypothetical protein
VFGRSLFRYEIVEWTTLRCAPPGSSLHLLPVLHRIAPVVHCSADLAVPTWRCINATLSALL